MNNIGLISILSTNEYALLQIILELRERLKKRMQSNHEPLMTLQQNYLTALNIGAPKTIVTSLDKLCQLKVIEQVSNNFGECALYRFNSKEYHKLLRVANKHQCTLKTGRAKTAQQVSAAEIIDYIIGKSISKNE